MPNDPATLLKELRRAAAAAKRREQAALQENAALKSQLEDAANERRVYELRNSFIEIKALPQWSDLYIKANPDVPVTYTSIKSWIAENGLNEAWAANGGTPDPEADPE